MEDLIIRAYRLFLIILIPLCVNLSQTINLQSLPNYNTHIGLTFDKAFYDGNNNYSLFSGVFQLFANTPISENLNLYGNIPFINMSYEKDFPFGNYEYCENGLGNIFIGLQTNSDISENNRTILSFGVFLPTSDEEIAYLGARINYYDFQKYIPNSLGLYFNFAFHRLALNGFNLGFEVGPNVIIPTKGEGRETELLLHYGLNLGYKIKKILLNAEFLGVGIVTEEVDNFEDRLIHQLNFGAQWKGGIVNPIIYYRIYLKEEFRDAIKGLLGLGINVAIY